MGPKSNAEAAHEVKSEKEKQEPNPNSAGQSAPGSSNAAASHPVSEAPTVGFQAVSTSHGHVGDGGQIMTARQAHMRTIQPPPPAPKPRQPKPGEITDDLKMPDVVQPKVLYSLTQQDINTVDQRFHFKTPTQDSENAARESTSFDVHALRLGFANLDESQFVLTNHFTVDIADNTVLYQYHIGGLPDDVSSAKRKTLVTQMISNCPILAYNRGNFATDYQGKIIAWKNLSRSRSPNAPEQFQPLPPDSMLDMVSVTKYNSSHDDQNETLDLTLTYTRSIHFQHLTEYVSGRNLAFNDNGISDALNIVFSGVLKDMTEDPSIIRHGPNRFFAKAGWASIDNGLHLVSLRGYFFSVHPKMGQLTLNLNTVMSTFHFPETVQKFLEHTSFVSQNHQQQAKLKKHLKGLRVRIMYSRASPDGSNRDIDDEARRTRTITGFGKAADDQTFKLGDGGERNHE